VSFEEIFYEHSPAVYRYLCFKLQDERLAEDLLQETFLAVHQQMDQLKEVLDLRSWILGIAHHKMVDYLRKRRLSTLELEHDLPSPPQKDSLELWEMLRELDGDARTIIYGLYVEGLTYAELAHILDIPEGTVKSRAHTARARLRRWMEGR